MYEDREIAVVYFRAGYTPNDYPTDKEWTSRSLIEHSKAIKCPTIAYHLVGTKKVQQVLALPGQLERFFSSEQSVLLRQSFAGLYALDSSPESKEIIARVLEKQGRGYVIKPQREGGGNNIYGADIPSFLNSLKPGEIEAYILMDLIESPKMEAILVRNGELLQSEVVSELGIYGIFVA